MGIAPGIESVSLYPLNRKNRSENPNIFRVPPFIVGLKSACNISCRAYCAFNSCGMPKAARHNFRY
jgi:hypothetical protein